MNVGVRASLVLLATTLAVCVSAKGPIFDYDCSTKCLKKYGWDPVCVDNGRDPGVEGTLFPNECALKCTSNTDDTTPHYHYLPFDDLICRSAVGCSLLGQMVERCHKLWETPEDQMTISPKVSDDCGCQIIAEKIAAEAALHDVAPAPAPAFDQLLVEEAPGDMFST